MPDRDTSKNSSVPAELPKKLFRPTRVTLKNSSVPAEIPHKISLDYPFKTLVTHDLNVQFEILKTAIQHSTSFEATLLYNFF